MEATIGVSLDHADFNVDVEHRCTTEDGKRGAVGSQRLPIPSTRSPAISGPRTRRSLGQRRLSTSVGRSGLTTPTSAIGAFSTALSLRLRLLRPPVAGSSSGPEHQCNDALSEGLLLTRLAQIRVNIATGGSARTARQMVRAAMRSVVAWVLWRRQRSLRDPSGQSSLSLPPDDEPLRAHEGVPRLVAAPLLPRRPQRGNPRVTGSRGGSSRVVRRSSRGIVPRCTTRLWPSTVASNVLRRGCGQARPGTNPGPERGVWEHLAIKSAERVSRRTAPFA